jgi:hypothetical protein
VGYYVGAWWLRPQAILETETNPILPLLSVANQLGGFNSLLQMEQKPAIPLAPRVQIPTMILGMDVSHSHGLPGRERKLPSVAAVTSTFSPLSCIILDASAV